MFQRRVLPYLGLMIVMVAVPALAAEKARDLSEKQKIEALIRWVFNSRDIKFIRKETELDGQSAAEFLRTKWAYRSDEIRTAEDFIRICSVAPDGEKYRFRINGTEVSAEWLLETELGRI